MNKMIFSIICPIYKGNKYISRLISIAEKNSEALNTVLFSEVELILVNDYPEERLSFDKNAINKIKLHIIQLKKNKGIHNARVVGYKKSKGQFIVFLDQDDYIADNFLLSQWEKLGDADVVVANGINRRKVIYKSYDVQEKCMTRDTFINNRNQIISPGQTLIRKSAIPSTWTDNIIKNNGADDYFLWLLMLKEDKQFACNAEILYKHILHSYNASTDSLKMDRSRNEMLIILLLKGYIGMKEYFRIRKVHRN